MSEHTWARIDKSAWGDGPWKDEPDKIQWVDAATGLDCLAVRHESLGHWCGYVGVPEGHPLFNATYHACPIDCGKGISCEHSPERRLSVHGGITFSNICQESNDPDAEVCHIPDQGRPAHVWWFGFDCAHTGDFRPGLAALTNNPMRFAGAHAGELYRTLDYVKGECHNLAEQLAMIAKGGYRGTECPQSARLSRRMKATDEHVKRSGLRAIWWYAVHNMIAHPLLVLGELFGIRWPDRFHDWTAGKI